jgi:hypothetical protein
VKRVSLGLAFIVAELAIVSSARAAAVSQLADDVARALGALPAAAVVVAAPLVTDQAAPKGDDLALRVAALLAGRIAKATRAHNQPAQLGTARALAGKGGALVYVQVEIAKGELRASADVYPVMRNSWDRVRNPLPAPTAHAFASAKIDAEVRAFLAPIVLEQAEVHKATHEEKDVLAAACGDVDGDGGMELAIVSRTRVTLGHVRGGKFVPLHAEVWSKLAPRAPAPLREPIGSAVIASGLFEDSHDSLASRGPRLLVGSTDRGGVSLTPNFALHSELFGIPLAFTDGPLCARANAGASALEGPLVDCAMVKAPEPKLDLPAARFDAFALANISARDGGTKTVVAAREPGGKLRVRVGDAPARTYEGVGAQIAIADLDQDGAPELVTTLDGEPDAITIATLPALPASGATGAVADPKVRMKLAAPGGVRALCTCPPEERGAPALVAVVGSEVWIIR